MISGVAWLAFSDMSSPSHMYRSPPCSALVGDWSTAHTSKEDEELAPLDPVEPVLLESSQATAVIRTSININPNNNLTFILLLLKRILAFAKQKKDLAGWRSRWNIAVVKCSLQAHGPHFIFTTTNTGNITVFNFFTVVKNMSHAANL
jgi:hypothetical protein